MFLVLYVTSALNKPLFALWFCYVDVIQWNISFFMSLCAVLHVSISTSVRYRVLPLWSRGTFRSIPRK